MYIKKLFFLGLLTICVNYVVLGQKWDSIAIDSKKSSFESCIIRPTFLEISVRSLPAINYYPARDIPKAESFERNKLYSLKLNLPIILSKKLNVIAQLRYKNEQLHLGESEDVYEREIHFDNAGLSIVYQYNFDNDLFLAGHLGGYFKSDKFNFEQYSSILDYSSSVLIGKNIEHGKVGFGAIFGNSLGRFRTYPLFLLDYDFSRKWRMEVKLPKEIKVRRIVRPDNLYLIAGAEIHGASYFISEDIIPDEKNIEYRRAAVEINIGIEKEIADFLWFGAELGITQPIYSALVRSGDPTRNKLFNFDHSFTPYGSVSLFIVPPRSLYKKFK
jgi:hypothetical protein